jgi:hypothetical protein
MSFALFFADDSPEAEMTYRQSNKSALLPPPAGRLLSEQDAAGLADAAEMTPPLVSVIIPCYNSARYLAETIASALGQTYPRIEVIVIDDGSTDDTPGIARSFPVTYLYQANCGVSAARNKGIFRSRGKYVLFLDHDDRLLPEAVATGVRLLEEHPECAVAVGEHRYIGADGTELGYSNKRAAGRDHYLMLLEGNFVETPCSALHRRSRACRVPRITSFISGRRGGAPLLVTTRRSQSTGCTTATPPAMRNLCCR